MNINIAVSWADMKAFIDQRKVICQWVSLSGKYHVFASDSGFGLSCIIMQDGSAASEISEFEATYKASGNKSPAQAISISSTPAFASKSFGNKSLYKRVTGQQASVVVGDNTIIYTQTFPWVKFMALEIINGEVGDYCSLFILDTITGAYSTIPNYVFNQFGFNANIAAGFYEHKSEFDADVFVGIQIKIVYRSISAKTIGINYVMNEVK